MESSPGRKRPRRSPEAQQPNAAGPSSSSSGPAPTQPPMPGQAQQPPSQNASPSPRFNPQQPPMNARLNGGMPYPPQGAPMPPQQQVAHQMTSAVSVREYLFLLVKLGADCVDCLVTTNSSESATYAWRWATAQNG